MTRILSFTLALVFVLALPSALAQPSAFKTLTIHENTSGNGKSEWKTVTDSGDKLSYEARNMTLRQLIEYAYGLREDQIRGIPDELKHKRFDIKAQLAKKYTFQVSEVPTDDSTFSPLQLMVRKVLRERFGLKEHVETRQRTIYNLVPVEGGPHLTESVVDCSTIGNPKQRGACGAYGLQNGLLQGSAASMSKLAETLAFYLDTEVVNKTFLHSTYNVKVQWQEPTSGKTADFAAPLAAAMQQQIGITLQSAKGPVTTLVIDHVEAPAVTS